VNVLRYALLALVLVMSSTASHAAPSTRDVVRLWYDLNKQCRGGSGDDPRTEEACNRRQEVDDQLRRAGCSYYGDRWVCP
jgi:hypothetical protein